MAKPKKKPKSPPRRTRKFQLRQNHPQDLHVQEVLDYARSQRREVTLIREAITLYYALEQGNLEMLFEKFPQYKGQFATGTIEALQQFMHILQKQQGQPALAGAGLVSLMPPMEVKTAVAEVSGAEMLNNFLSFE